MGLELFYQDLHSSRLIELGAEGRGYELLQIIGLE